MKLITATAMLMLLTSAADAACNSANIMNCTRAEMGQTYRPPPPRERTVTCTTVRTSNGTYTECTSS